MPRAGFSEGLPHHAPASHAVFITGGEPSASHGEIGAGLCGGCAPKDKLESGQRTCIGGTF